MPRKRNVFSQARSSSVKCSTAISPSQRRSLPRTSELQYGTESYWMSFTLYAPRSFIKGPLSAGVAYETCSYYRIPRGAIWYVLVDEESIQAWNGFGGVNGDLVNWLWEMKARVERGGTSHYDLVVGSGTHLSYVDTAFLDYDGLLQPCLVAHHVGILLATH